MDDLGLIMAEIEKLSKKIDQVPTMIRMEIRNAINMIGLNPDKPTETQELVCYLREKKERDDQIKKRTIDNFSNLVFKGFVALVAMGFIAYYTQTLVSTAVKTELSLIDNRRTKAVVTKEIRD